MRADHSLSPIGVPPIVRLEAAHSNQQQKALSQMFPLCRYTAFLLNEAKPVVQRQSMDKRGSTKKDLSTHVSRTISRGVKKEWDPERGRGCMGRKTTTVRREGKCSHSCCHYSSHPSGYYGLERSSGCVPCGRCYSVTQSRWPLLFPFCVCSTLLGQ